MTITTKNILQTEENWFRKIAKDSELRKDIYAEKANFPYTEDERAQFRQMSDYHYGRQDAANLIANVLKHFREVKYRSDVEFLARLIKDCTFLKKDIERQIKEYAKNYVSYEFQYGKIEICSMTIERAKNIKNFVSTYEELSDATI